MLSSKSLFFLRFGQYLRIPGEIYEKRCYAPLFATRKATLFALLRKAKSGLCLNASKAESRARAQRCARASARKYIFFNHGQCGTDDGMGLWGQFAIWNFPIFCRPPGLSPSSWPKPKFPVESVNIGRIIFFDIFFNSARKVRKNGIGPIKIREKKFQS